MKGKQSIGDFRLDGDYVAIKLDSKFRGKGYGMEIINMVKRVGMLAKIVDGNVPSMRLFIKCGFNVREHKVKNGVGYYILSYEGDS